MFNKASPKGATANQYAPLTAPPLGRWGSPMPCSDPMNASVSEIIVDARGAACPLPILELAKALRTAEPGAMVALLATDPAVKPDLEAFCQATGHELVSLAVEEGTFRARIRKA